MAGIIALDMDGTLLNESGNIPDSFWEVATQAKEKGFVIAPASGRQLKTLQDVFERDQPRAFIAENGTVVALDGEVVSTTTIEPELVARAIDAALTTDAAVVICKPETAIIAAGHPEATAKEIAKYYHARTEVQELKAVSTENVVKLALYTPSNAEKDVAPVVKDAVPELNMAVSGMHWVDIMTPRANKGLALHALADSLGIDRANTIAFGDYLNDYELLQAAGTAYAMDNAHPRLKEIADHIAPSNADEGVIVELKKILD